MCTAPRKCVLCLLPASEWKEDIEWIAHHTHSDVKKCAAPLVCDCSNKLALRKSKQPWSQDRMFLTCYKKECGFFLWIDQPISHGIKDRLSYSPQPGSQDSNLIKKIITKLQHALLSILIHKKKEFE